MSQDGSPVPTSRLCNHESNIMSRKSAAVSDRSSQHLGASKGGDAEEAV